MVQVTLHQESLQVGTITGTKRNTKKTFLEGLVKRVINDKSASNNKKMAYGYYPKMLKDYGSALLS